MTGSSFKVAIPDRAYWRRQIRCQDACPVGTDARGYVRAIAGGDFERAYLIARGPNPLASICGRICGAPCEANCRRGRIDAAVSIRALKRFAVEQYRARNCAEDPAGLLRRLSTAGPERACRGSEDITAFAHWLGSVDPSGALGSGPPAGEPVAVIGGGPAGLAAAHDLALMGFRPTVFETEEVPAGMLYTGVPEYRLPRDLIRAEVEVIRSLGVEFRCGVEVGKDIPLDRIRREFAAVVIAVGLKRSRKIPIPGTEAPGVLGAVEFLREIAFHRTVHLGERVVVIGGGNVAYDAARTAVRQSSVDASRSALRLPGVHQVTLCSLESLEEMPADDAEIIEGDEEGVVRLNRVGPKEILLDGAGKARGVRMVKVLSVFDADGRFAPKYDESAVTELEADSVILAIGQRGDLSFIESARDGVRLDQRGGLVLDAATQATSAPGVFAAGDIAHGPRLMIHAIASGKRAAREVHRFLRGMEIRPEELDLHLEVPGYRREKDYERLPRASVPIRPRGERMAGMAVEAERGYDEIAARREASRCLDCGVNTIFDGDRCILCGGCADVCPEGCLRLVSAARLESTPELERILAARLDDLPRERAAAIIKDEDRCIRCALCMERCPVGAITMERYVFSEAWREAPSCAAACAGSGGGKEQP